MRADAAANRSQLINAAWRLFAAKGAETSLREVAKEAGVGIGTLYRHFPDRGELVLGLLQEVAATIQSRLNHALAQWDADPQAAWTALIHELAALRVAALIGSLDISQELTEAQLQQAQETRAEMLNHFEAVLHRAQQAGVAADDLTPTRLVVAIAAITRPLPAPINTVAPKESLEAWLTELLLRGLGPNHPN
ncbi:TetR/AcrR family transcriptional regulator [Kocuria sp.]|uniref:TetR/AcrR family transcriptional regulator n=1 Tax=Kocuria sp. TaxID=1871328 RepID=UPI0026E07C4A|nr:TetR/AcrR family transcriptional regulator [Kocuria sp.]MDO5617992.1 helix-turn-helix domain-containing protein [Kocuria sp.]